MQNSRKIYPIEGVVQHYNWGGYSFIPHLLNIPVVPNQPSAEWWLGAHQNAPAVVRISNNESIPLDTFLQSSPTAMLGESVARDFGRLPYLFKVLDVKHMLSIQVHPSKEAAVRDFARENSLGISLKDPKRNYKDDNHKPELMYALSDFWLLHGFRPPEEMQSILTAVPELNFLLPVWQKGQYEGLYRFAMELPDEEVNRRLTPLIDRILPLYEAGQLHKDQPDFWAARAYQTFCGEGRMDKGLFSVYFFNVLHLLPGEAIFQDAGILHAYLEGQNLEIMANSDNVLRGGLTNKHVDVAELMKHVRFEPTYPLIQRSTDSTTLQPQPFSTPARDFELQKIDLGAGQKMMLETYTTDIFLVTEGHVEAKEGDSVLSFHKGEAFVVLANAHLILEAQNKSVVFRATVPYPQS